MILLFDLPSLSFHSVSDGGLFYFYFLFRLLYFTTDIQIYLSFFIEIRALRIAALQSGVLKMLK